ncbi:hypothetical protein YQE_12250, partial [Dendroctonus ponderosae]
MRLNVSPCWKKGIPIVISPEGWVFITPPLVDVFSVLQKQVAMLDGQSRANQDPQTKILNESGLSAKHSAKGPLLTIAHKQATLELARDHVDLNLDDWKIVLFTDEVRVGLKSSDGRAFIWKRPGERYSQACVVPQLVFRGGSIIFWGGISLEAIRRRSLTSQKYIQEILKTMSYLLHFT